MKNIKIKKVAVIGSGIMGSRIACHLVNVGMDVLLLDICPKELNKKEISLRSTCEQPSSLTEDEVKLLIKNDWYK